MWLAFAQRKSCHHREALMELGYIRHRRYRLITLNTNIMKKVNLRKNGENLDDGFLGISFVIILVKLIIGVVFLIPPILGAFFFTLNVFDVNWDAVTLRDLHSNWTGEAFSAAPIYLGLMALAGVFMVRFAFSDYLDLLKFGNSVDSIEITEEDNNK